MLDSNQLLLTVAAQAVELTQIKANNEDLVRAIKARDKKLKALEESLSELQPKDEDKDGS